MEIFLNKANCVSLTGTLCKKHGYYISRRGKRFYGYRRRRNVPPDGHWLFIRDYAEMAAQGMLISDINIHWYELQSALYEAHHFVAAQHVRANYNDKAKASYDARDIINLKTLFGL